VPLKEVQNARAALDAAENDVRSAEVALEATRNRLRRGSRRAAFWSECVGICSSNFANKQR
jgi:hypothetical protein